MNLSFLTNARRVTAPELLIANSPGRSGDGFKTDDQRKAFFARRGGGGGGVGGSRSRGGNSATLGQEGSRPIPYTVGSNRITVPVRDSKLQRTAAANERARQSAVRTQAAGGATGLGTGDRTVKTPDGRTVIVGGAPKTSAQTWNSNPPDLAAARAHLQRRQYESEQRTAGTSLDPRQSGHSWDQPIADRLERQEGRDRSETERLVRAARLRQQDDLHASQVRSPPVGYDVAHNAPALAHWSPDHHHNRSNMNTTAHTLISNAIRVAHDELFANRPPRRGRGFEDEQQRKAFFAAKGGGRGGGGSGGGGGFSKSGPQRSDYIDFNGWLNGTGSGGFPGTPSLGQPGGGTGRAPNPQQPRYQSPTRPVAYDKSGRPIERDPWHDWLNGTGSAPVGVVGTTPRLDSIGRSVSPLPGGTAVAGGGASGGYDPALNTPEWQAWKRQQDELMAQGAQPVRYTRDGVHMSVPGRGMVFLPNPNAQRAKPVSEIGDPPLNAPRMPHVIDDLPGAPFMPRVIDDLPSKPFMPQVALPPQQRNFNTIARVVEHPQSQSNAIVSQLGSQVGQTQRGFRHGTTFKTLYDDKGRSVTVPDGPISPALATQLIDSNRGKAQQQLLADYFGAHGISAHNHHARLTR